MRMPWGKHKGEQLEDMDTGYLRWICENVTSDAALVKARAIRGSCTFCAGSRRGLEISASSRLLEAPMAAEKKPKAVGYMSHPKRVCQHGKPYRSRMVIDMCWCSDECYISVITEQARWFAKLLRRARTQLPDPPKPKTKRGKR